MLRRAKLPVILVANKVDLYEKYLTDYLIKVSNLSISEKQHILVNNLFHAIIDIERVSDRAENLAELTQYKIENNIVFSEKATAELKQIGDKVYESFEKAVNAREAQDGKIADEVIQIEEGVDTLEQELRDKHRSR